MGYNGLGMQRWIFTMKPRKFLGKRSKPDGGGGESSAGINLEDYFQVGIHYKGTGRKKEYSASYRKKLLWNLAKEKKRQQIILLLSVFISLSLLTLLFLYLNHKMHWF